MPELTYEVTAEHDGSTLERFLRSRGISHRLMTKMKRTDGGMTRCGALLRTVDIVHAGDVIMLKMPDEAASVSSNPDLHVNRLYEDSHIIVYDKPFGMPVHPSVNHHGDTLANCFAHEYPDCAFRPVNRLDKDTSGLCLCARNAASANIADVKKTYYAAVHGIITGCGRIDAPIGRAENSVILRRVREDGRPSVTNYEPLMHSGKYTLLRISLETGRTHQIRVHFSWSGHPLAGDDLYGGSREDIGRQALHCGDMDIIHPITGRLVSVHSDIPEDIMKLFGKDR